MQIEEIYLCSHRLLNVAEMIAAEQLKKYQLSLRQCWLLLYINHRHPDGTSVTELHKELCISKASLSESMKKLQCMDYIKAVCCKSDEYIFLRICRKNLVKSRKSSAKASEKSL